MVLSRKSSITFLPLAVTKSHPSRVQERAPIFCFGGKRIKESKEE